MNNTFYLKINNKKTFLQKKTFYFRNESTHGLLFKINYCLTKEHIKLKTFIQEGHKAVYWKKEKSAFPQVWLTKDENVPLRYDHPNGLWRIHICIFYQKINIFFPLKCDIYYAFTFKPSKNLFKMQVAYICLNKIKGK